MKTLGTFGLKYCSFWTENTFACTGMKTELFQNNFKSQGAIYRALFHHKLHLLMHVVKDESVIKLHNHSIICTRQEEFGNEAKCPKVITTVQCSICSQLNNILE